MSIRRFLLGALILLSGLCHSCFGAYVPIASQSESEQPWFTGPLLTPSARAVSIGHINLEPYLYWTVVTGKYGPNWSVLSTPKAYQLNPLLVYKIGIWDNISFGGSIQGFYNRTQGQSSWAFGDLPLGFEIGLVEGKKDTWVPYVKLTLMETFPTGKYQKLSSRKLGTDSGGQGAYGTTVGLTFSKLFYYPEHHFMNVRWNFVGYFPSSARVKGINTFGGDITTRGHIRPGATFLFQTAAEYNLTQKWALALDFQAFYSGRNHFKGRTITPVGSPSSVQLSVAPAIEYNWSENMGIIVGSWFTVAGRNANRFASAAAAYNYYY